MKPRPVARPARPRPPPQQRRPTGLARFIAAHCAEILALAPGPAGRAAGFAGRAGGDAVPLRAHAAGVLRSVALSLLRAPGRNAPGPVEDASPALQENADEHWQAGEGVEAIVAEYRDMRSRVLEGWRGNRRNAPLDAGELARFNLLLDDALAEEVRLHARRSEAANDLFIGAVAHDIRNPLGTILHCAEYLVLSGRCERADLAPVTDAAHRIQAIVEQTIDYTTTHRAESLPLKLAPCSLLSVAGKVVQETQVRHPDQPISLAAHGIPQGRWDAGRLAQVLSNLLENAIVYGKRGAAITVRVWPEDGLGCCSVHNLGAPIPAAEQDRIFDALVQGKAAGPERRLRGGLGLGLYICREIVRAHGGTIAVESSAAQGTAFTVRLPAGNPGAA